MNYAIAPSQKMDDPENIALLQDASVFVRYRIEPAGFGFNNPPIRELTIRELYILGWKVFSLESLDELKSSSPYFEMESLRKNPLFFPSELLSDFKYLDRCIKRLFQILLFEAEEDPVTHISTYYRLHNNHRDQERTMIRCTALFIALVRYFFSVQVPFQRVKTIGVADSMSWDNVFDYIDNPENDNVDDLDDPEEIFDFHTFKNLLMTTPEPNFTAVFMTFLEGNIPKDNASILVHGENYQRIEYLGQVLRNDYKNVDSRVVLESGYFHATIAPDYISGPLEYYNRKIYELTQSITDKQIGQYLCGFYEVMTEVDAEISRNVLFPNKIPSIMALYFDQEDKLHDYRVPRKLVSHYLNLSLANLARQVDILLTCIRDNEECYFARRMYISLLNHYEEYSGVFVDVEVARRKKTYERSLKKYIAVINSAKQIISEIREYFRLRFMKRNYSRLMCRKRTPKQTPMRMEDFIKIVDDKRNANLTKKDAVEHWVNCWKIAPAVSILVDDVKVTPVIGPNPCQGNTRVRTINVADYPFGQGKFHNLRPVKGILERRIIFGGSEDIWDKDSESPTAINYQTMYAKYLEKFFIEYARQHYYKKNIWSIQHLQLPINVFNEETFSSAYNYWVYYHVLFTNNLHS